MKKILCVLLSCVCVLTVNAQYREVRMPKRPKTPTYNDYNTKDEGFWCAVELDGGSSVMLDSPNVPYTSLTFTGGYRFSEYLRVGAGLGCRMNINNADYFKKSDKFNVPIYANLRGNFISAYHRDGVPFWSVNVGGLTSQGFYANPTVGYSFGGLRNNFLIGLSYTISSFTNHDNKDMAYSYFGIKLGYEF